jgi:copper chaperone CopZ
MKTRLLVALSYLFVAGVAGAVTIEMKVHGMVCGYCVQGIEKILRKNPATDQVLVSLENRLVALTTRDGQDISDAALTRAITDAGYEVKGISRTTRTIEEIRGEVARTAKR